MIPPVYFVSRGYLMISIFNKFIPDLIYTDIYDIDLEYLKSAGIKGIIFDIDNTLVSYDTPSPTEKVMTLIDSLRENGFKLSLISNNKPGRVELFNKDLKLTAFADAGKPSIKAIKTAAQLMELPHDKIAIIGDQIFTDVYAGKRAGTKAILVNPIEGSENLFFKFKRLCEKPFIKEYYKRNNI